MKGLLIKDCKLMLGQKSFLGLAALMGILYLGIYNDPTFAIMFVTIMCSIFSVSTLSYDEHENGMAYLFTLPIRKKDYVLEKYVFFIMSTAITGGVMFVLACIAVQIRGLETSWDDLYVGILIAWFVCAVLVSYMIPASLKFGVEKSRIVMGSGMAAIFLMVYLAIKISKSGNTNVERFMQVLGSMSEGVVVLMILTVAVALIVISCVISMKVMKKREF